MIRYDQIELNRRTVSEGDAEVITTKTMNYESDYTSHDYPNVSTADYYTYRYRNSQTSNFSEYMEEVQVTTPYCNPTDVEDWINENINSEDTEINYDQVEKIIAGISAEIDDETNSSWDTKTITQEYHDGLGLRGDEYFLEFGPILTMTTLQTTQSSEDTNASDVTWDTLTENDDFFMDKETTKISITDSSKNPNDGRNRFRATYNYGHTSIPKDIRRLATLMTIRDMGKANAMKSLIKGHNEFANFAYTALDKEIEMLLNKHRREKQYNT